MNVELRIQLSNGKTETFVTPPNKIEATNLGFIVHRDESTETYKAEEIEDVRMRWSVRKPQTAPLLNDYV